MAGAVVQMPPGAFGHTLHNAVTGNANAASAPEGLAVVGVAASPIPKRYIQRRPFRVIASKPTPAAARSNHPIELPPD
jgi:hypothetical protein